MPLPTDKACGASNDSRTQEMTWGGYLRIHHQTQPTFKKPTATHKFSSHPLRKKKNYPKLQQDKVFSTPNYCRKDDRMTAISPYTHQKDHPHKSIRNKCRREPGSEGTLLHVNRNGHWQQSLEKTVSACQENKISSTGSDIPTLGVYPEKTIIQEDTYTPTFTAKTQNNKISTHSLNKIGYIFTIGYYLAINKHT